MTPGSLFAYFKSPELLYALLILVFLKHSSYGVLKSEVVPVLHLACVTVPSVTAAGTECCPLGGDCIGGEARTNL